jgi:DNA repair exonuclease SbcCD ATPase subunit
MKASHLATLVNQYKNRLEDRPPYKKDGQLYFRRTDGDREVLYLQATCDELRHGLTNYEQLLMEIKKLNFDHDSAKEAVIYAIKFEATRKVYQTQKKWIKVYYDSLIVNIENHSLLKEAKQENEQIKIKLDALEKNKDLLLSQVQQKDAEIKNLQQEVKKYIALWQQYEKKLEKEKARREELAKNNMSLGSYKGHFNKAQKKIKEMKQEIETLKTTIKKLEKQIEIQ